MFLSPKGPGELREASHLRQRVDLVTDVATPLGLDAPDIERLELLGDAAQVHALLLQSALFVDEVHEFVRIVLWVGLWT